MAGKGSKPGERRGGRPKGGRNKSTKEIKEILDKNVDFAVVVQKLYETSQGVLIQETDKKGETHIYEKPPDGFAAKILLEYRFGKPAQAIDLTTGGKSFEDFLKEVKK